MSGTFELWSYGLSYWVVRLSHRVMAFGWLS
jgi:hypothetical protein